MKVSAGALLELAILPRSYNGSQPSAGAANYRIQAQSAMKWAFSMPFETEFCLEPQSASRA